MPTALERLEANAAGLRHFDRNSPEDLRLALQVIYAARSIRRASGGLDAALQSLEATS